jgi:hypothetical protein
MMTLRIKDNTCPHDFREIKNAGPANETHVICIICKKRRKLTRN